MSRIINIGVDRIRGNTIKFQLLKGDGIGHLLWVRICTVVVDELVLSTAGDGFSVHLHTQLPDLRQGVSLQDSQTFERHRFRQALSEGVEIEKESDDTCRHKTDNPVFHDYYFFPFFLLLFCLTN